MEKREKVELLLEQMRLCLKRKDYIRAQIIAKKISIKFFEDEASEVSFMFYFLRKQYQYIEIDYSTIGSAMNHQIISFRSSNSS